MPAGLERTDPIVVIGMHRSGTRLLAEVLARLGVFMGADQQADSESVTFMLINEAVFHQCGTFWNEPMPVHFVLSEPELRAQAAAIAEQTLAQRLGSFIGASDWRAQTGRDPRPFGWKDPRNTFTLPVWRHVFPDLRAIHVLRHGVDVAASLARRHGAALRAATGEEFPPALTVVRDDVLGILSSRRGWTRAEAFTMWEQYVEKARVEIGELGARALEVRFEDLLERPETQIPRIVELCGLPVPERIEDVIERPRVGRAFAYRGDPELVELARSVRPALERHGYSV